MVWFRYLSNKEVLGTTTPNENYSYPLLKRVIPKFTPKDTIPDKTWIFVDVTGLNIDKYYDADLQLQTDDASYIVVYEDPFTDDYFVPVKTVIHEDILYFETAEEHPAGVEIDKQYAVYYKTKGLRKIVEVDNGGRTDYQIYNLPVWVDNQLATIPIDAPYSDSVFAVSDPVATYSISRGRLPEGITLNSTTGAVTGSTTYVGRYFFTIRATSIHGYIEADFSDDIGTNPDTPTGEISNFYYGENYYHSFAIQSSGPVQYYIASGSLPDGVSLDVDTGIMTGIVTLDKPYYSNTQYNFTVAIQNQYGTTYKEYSGTVYHAPDWVVSENVQSIELDTDYSDSIKASGYPQVTYKVEQYNITANGLYTDQSYNIFYDKNISAVILELNTNSYGQIIQTQYSQFMESAHIIEPDANNGFYLGGNFTAKNTTKFLSTETQKIIYINSSGLLGNWSLKKNTQSYHALGSISSIKLSGANIYITTDNVGFYDNSTNSIINYQFGIASKQSGEILDFNLHTKNGQLPGKFTDSLVIGSNIYLSGEFTSVNLPPSSYINYDVQQQTSLPPYPIAASSNIYSIHRDSFGGIYLGGTFTSVNGKTRNRLAYINSSGKLDDLNINVNGPVYAIATIGANIYIGGNFTLINSQNAGNIAVVTRLGQILNLGLNVNGIVRSLDVVGSNIYVGGTFTKVLSPNPTNTLSAYARARFGVAAINTSGSLLNWKTGFTSNSGPNVSVIKHNNGIIYVGGNFNDASYPTSSFYNFNKNGTIANVIPDVSSNVYAITVDAAGGYYIGGDFTYIDNEVRTGLAYINSSGNLTSWNPGIIGTIHDIAVNGDNVYIGGSFIIPGFTGTRYLTAYDINGQQLEWNPAPNGTIYSIKIINDIIYIGGNFTSVDASSKFGLAAIDSFGVIQETWNPIANGQVRSLHVDGENIYIGGDFTTINDNVRLRVALINTSANLLDWDPGSRGNVYTISRYANVTYIGGDFSYNETNAKSSIYTYNTSGYLVGNNLGVIPNIFCIQQDTSGGFYIAGNFTSVGGVARNRAAYINNSGQLTAWNPSINGPIHAMLLYGENIYLGGNFTSVSNTSRYSLAAVNTLGNLLSWNPGTDGIIYNIFNIGSNLYIGGNYTILGAPRSSYLRLYQNGSSFISRYEIRQPIRCMVRDVSGGIYIGGDFTSIGDQTRNRIAYVNSLGFLTDWNPNVNGNVLAMAISGSNIYFGGSFTEVSGNTRNRLAAVNATGGLLSWNPSANGNIYAMAIIGTNVYVGGEFLNVGSTSHYNFAILNVNSNTISTGYSSYQVGLPVRAITTIGSNIYIGGDFTVFGGSNRLRLAAIATNGALITSWRPNANGSVRVLTSRGVNVYIGGQFTTITASVFSTGTVQTVTRNCMASVNTINYVSETFIANTNGNVFAISAYGSNIYFGGEFTTVNGTTRNRLAVMQTTGSLLTTWTPNVDGNVLSIIAYQDGATPSFHVGGAFTTASDRIRNSLASIDTTGAVSTFNPNVILNVANNTVGTVYAIAYSGNNIYIGGDFTRVNGNARNRLSAINTASNVLAWNPNATHAVRAIGILGDNVYVGGDFIGIGTTYRRYAASINISDGSTTSWDINVDASVKNISVNTENAIPYIYLAGDFTSVKNQKRMYSAKVNTSADLIDWNPSTNGNVYALSIYGDNVIIAGNFYDTYATVRPYIYAVDDLGDLVPWNATVDGIVRKISIIGEGATPNIYIGGDFTSVNGQNQKYIAGLDVNNNILLWSPNVNNSVFDIETLGDNVYFGGAFDFLHKQAIQNFSAVNTSGFLVDFEPYPNNSVRDIDFYGSNIYFGGDFTGLKGGSTTLSTVNVDNGQFEKPLLAVNGPVHELIFDGNGGVYIGGDFTQVNGVTRYRLAHIDEFGNVTGWNPSSDGVIYSMSMNNTDVYVGGDFNSISGKPRYSVAAISKRGYLLDWNPPVTGGWNLGTYHPEKEVNGIWIDGENVFIAGKFQAVCNQPKERFAKINTNGDLQTWSPSVSNLNRTVYDIYVKDNIVYVPTDATDTAISITDGNTGSTIGTIAGGGSASIYEIDFDGNNLIASGRLDFAATEHLEGVGSYNSLNNYSENWVVLVNNIGLTSTSIDVQGDNIYVGGEFSKVGGFWSGSYIYTKSGQDLTTLQVRGSSRINSTSNVLAYSVDSSGGIYLGGNFTEINGNTRNRLAYINNSGFLTDWNPNVNGNVRAIVVIGDNVYVGGGFGLAFSTQRNNLAAFNTVNINATGNLLTWNPSANSEVFAMKNLGNNIYIGGGFTNVSATLRRYAAVVNADGTLLGWNPSANANIYAIEISGSNIFIGGNFTLLSSGTVSKSRIAAISTNGTIQTFNADANSYVFAITVSGSNAYIGGAFTTIRGNTRNRIAAVDIATSTVLPWNPSPSSTVRAIKVDGDNIYIGGSFISISSTFKYYLALVNTSGTLLNWGHPDQSDKYDVYDIAISGDNIYVGGRPSWVKSVNRQKVAIINTSGNVLDWTFNADAIPKAASVIRVDGDKLFIGTDNNSFTLNNISRNYAAVVNVEGSILDWSPNTNGNVHAVAIVGSNIYFGGEFTQVNGSISRAYLASQNASNENVLLYNNNLTINGPVLALVSSGNNIYVGGSFTDYNIYNRNNLLAVNTSGKVLPWSPNVNAIVKTMTALGSNIYIAGSFTKVNNLDFKGLAAVNTSGNVLSWNPYLTNLLSNVYSMMIDNGNVIVAGKFEKENPRLVRGFAAINNNSDVLTNTNYNLDESNYIYTFLRDSDNGFYIGGTFTEFKSPPSAYVKVDNLGNRLGFENQVNLEDGSGSINVVKVDSTGGFYIGGKFDFVNNVFRKNIAYINSSGYLTSFNPYVSGDLSNGEVLTIDILGSNIYIGGFFTSVNGNNRNYVAALDTSGNLLDWNPSASSWIYTISTFGDNIYIGGTFNSINGNTRLSLAAINTSGNVLAWNPSVNSSAAVYSSTIANGLIYVGGAFNAVGGNVRNRVAAIALDSGAIHGWNPDASGNVHAIVTLGPNVYLAGAFTALNSTGTPVTKNRLAAVDNATSVTIITSWSPNVNNTVRSMKISGTNIYIGGDFTTLNTSGTSTVSRIKSAAIGTNNAVLSWNLNLNSLTTSNVYSIDIYDSGSSITVHLAGTSNIYQDIKARNRLAYINSSGAITDWNPNVNGNVHTMALSGVNIYIGGKFSSVGGNQRNSVAAINTVNVNATGHVLSWNPYVNDGIVTGLVNTMAISGSNIYIGGTFTNIGGSSKTSFGGITTSGEVLLLGFNVLSNLYSMNVDTLAVSNQTLYIGGLFKITSNITSQYSLITNLGGGSLHDNINAVIHAAVADGAGGFYVGGSFSSIGGEVRSNLAYINSIGRVDTWNPSANANVYAIAILGSSIYFGGAFDVISGTSRTHLAAVSTSGTLLPWNPVLDGWVKDIKISGSNIYVAGYFNEISTNPRYYIAGFSNSGTLLSWNPSADNSVESIAVSGDNIYLSGDFNYIAGQARKYIAGITVNGTILSWSPNVNNIVSSIDAIGDNIYIGGYFTSVNSTTRNRLAAVNSLGDLLAWNPNASGAVSSISILGSNIYVAGNFLKISNEKKPYLAAIDSEGSGQLVNYNPPSFDNEVSFIYGSGEKILISGSFKTVNDNLRESFAAINISTNQLLPMAFTVRSRDNLSDESSNLELSRVKAITIDGVNIYIGGEFTYLNETRRNRLAAINTSGTILTFAPNVDQSVGAIHVSGDNIYIGGSFSSIDNNFSAFRTAIITKSGQLINWSPKPDGGIYKIQKFGDNIYIAGTFMGFKKDNIFNITSFDLNGKELYSKYLSQITRISNIIDQGMVSSFISKIRKSNNSIYVAMNYRNTSLAPLRASIISFDNVGTTNVINFVKQSREINIKNASINDLAILNEKVYIAGKFETDVLPVGLTLNSNTGEISGIHESQYYGKIVKEDIAATQLTSNYYVFNFSWIDGQNLDTRTTIISPIVSYTLGDDSYENNGLYFSFSDYLYWQKTDTGSGFESILFNKDNFDIQYPGTSQITFRIKSKWNSTIGVNPVAFNITGYVGGIITLGIKDNLYGYKDWSIGGQTETYENFSSYSKTISLQSSYENDLGDIFVDVTLDFLNGKVIYTTAYEAHRVIVSAENELGYTFKTIEM